MAENPLQHQMRDWLPQFDFAVLHHGFAPHGRDYVLILQAAGTYELILTHVVECHCQTAVRDDVWPVSWGRLPYGLRSVGSSGGARWLCVGH